MCENKLVFTIPLRTVKGLVEQKKKKPNLNMNSGIISPTKEISGGSRKDDERKG